MAAPLAGLLALGLVACGSGHDSGRAGAGSESGPIRVENCGTTVKLDAPPKHAVAISQPAIELLLTLGQADHMAGAAGWNDEVPAKLRAENAKVPQLGSQFPSFEKVLDTDPDFIYSTFAYGFTDEGVAPREKFTKLGVATYLSPSECTGQDANQTHRLTFDDVFAEVGDIAKIFGVQKRGDQLVTSLRSRLEDAADGVDASGVTLGWWYANTKTPYMAGCCGAPGMITKALGAKNAFEDQKQLWPEIGWETILKRDPDVLVLADLTRGGDGDSATAKEKFLRNNPAARQLTAVRKNRVIVVRASAMDPSIENVDGVEDVADGLRKLGYAR